MMRRVLPAMFIAAGILFAVLYYANADFRHLLHSRYDILMIDTGKPPYTLNTGALPKSTPAVATYRIGVLPAGFSRELVPPEAKLSLPARLVTYPTGRFQISVAYLIPWDVDAVHAFYSKLFLDRPNWKPVPEYADVQNFAAIDDSRGETVYISFGRAGKQTAVNIALFK